MDTKVQKRKDIPAGMFSGTEVFVKDDKAYALRDGERIDYFDLPGEIRAAFRKAFDADKEFVHKKWGKNIAVSKVFILWLNCKCGQLDGTPDYDPHTQQIVPDSNSFCGDCNCCVAGDICALPYDLTKDQVQTIQLSKQGFTQEQIGTMLYRSPIAIKNRLEKSREKLGAHNIAHLASLTPLIPTAR